MFDLGIEGGTVFTPSHRAHLNVYVSDGRIAAITPDVQPARERVNATDLFVMPGMIDGHVHFMDPGDSTRETFPTGSAAAARAGVTTVIEHTHGAPVRTATDLKKKRDHLRAGSYVDFGLAAHAWPEEHHNVEDVWLAGATFIKAFTCETHGVPGFDAAHLASLFELSAGLNAICLVHCEDASLTFEAERALRAAGRMDGGVVSAWRNRDAEVVATSVVSLLARRHNAVVVVAHASHPEVVEIVTREQQAGAHVMTETCPQYLTLLEDEVLDHGAFRKFTPPARARDEDDLQTMWRAVSDGKVNYLSSDHAPSTAEQKSAGSIWDVHFGLPGIDTTLSVLLDGAFRDRVSYERVVQVYAECPARIYGLDSWKGRLAVGADADVVLVDPSARWIVDHRDILSLARWSPLAGRELRGRAVRTYLRGQLAVADGQMMAECGAGHYLEGPGARRNRA